MKVLAWVLAVVVLAAIVFAILFPVFARPRQGVYTQVLGMHQDLPKWKAPQPFLYVSWFRNGSLKRGEDFAVYDNGDMERRRILTYAVEGGRGPMEDKGTLQTLRHLSSLPPGLNGPDTVPHGQLLIVSLRHKETWETQYYDRRNLPLLVQNIANLIVVQDN